MDLELLYNRVAAAVSSLDLGRVWPGFEPLKFALYDNEKCFFDGRYIEKTDEFCANTSILYHGEQIAIWMVGEELEIPVLTSKIVHEMFHGYQRLSGWDCWPDELEALYRYDYDAENLTLKLRENELLLALLDRDDGEALRELLAHRKLRSERFPENFAFESKFEEIEGTANYVEWKILKQLDEKKADELTGRMRDLLSTADYLFPIRISSYFTGALLINALSRSGGYPFDAAERPVIRSVLEDVAPSDGDFPGKVDAARKTAEAVAKYGEETDAIIRSAIEKGEVVLTGPLELAFVNVYNARCRGGFITSTYFLMYKENGEDRFLPGNFVVKMKDEKTIDTVYRMD